MKAIRGIGLSLLSIPVFGYCLWALAAIWIDGPSARPIAGALCAGLALLYLACLVRVRPYRRALLALAFLSAGVMVWWFTIPARNDRDWLPDVAQTARARFDPDGHHVTVSNIRDFSYRSETDYDPHWITRTFDLDQLTHLDLFISFWGPTLYAHTIMSWEFADQPPLAISIETRKEKGESYSALLGFFRQYELYYVVAQERDVIGVRDLFRGEQTFLYRLSAPRENARRLLVDYLTDADDLAVHPRWYNALTQNCTTSIRNRVMHAGGHVPLSWKLLLNGRLDELMYERGSLATKLPLAELRAKSEITAKAKAADSSPDFSALIRVGLPE
ncbi:MAG TPA: DUF4105 domain-containing protein [Myxococcota bacterium]|nr:DUF4105 domain-containing protein [Myxococcota bacterium]